MKTTTRQYLFIATVFTVVIVAICLSFPREKAINIEFVKGKPWRYEQLTAPFDFAITKSEEALQHEYAEVLASQRPYYGRDSQLGKAAIDSFITFYENELRHIVSKSLRANIISQLQDIYDTGIIGSNDLERLQGDSISTIMLIEQNWAQPVLVRDLYTVQQAYEVLMNVDTTLLGRYALRHSNLNDYITPNVHYDALKSETARHEALATISPNSGVILTGQKIIGTGEMIGEEQYQVLTSYQNELNKRLDEQGVQMTFVGQVLLVVLLIGAFLTYLINYRRSYLYERNKLLFLATQLMVFPCMASWIMSQGDGLMIIPFAMAPVMINIFLDARTAVMTHLVIVLITSLVVSDPFVFVLLQFTAGIAVIYSLTELTARSQIFRVAVVAILCYSLVFFGYELITKSALIMLNRHIFVHFLLNGVLLLFTYPLMLLYEKLFGFTSDVTLMELSNFNIKLLRQLSENAPGTFQHSIQVSNLAAAAANKVGASSLLVRTGAMYHDIGKLGNPIFFTENQGSTNPHACLPYEKSASIIIGHVHDGLRLAEKHHLPKAVKDFIRTHHGLSKAKYFYVSYKNEHPGVEVDESMFTYPGPNPHSMETAILMMADAVEAASRSLSEYTEENIANLVDHIIDGQVAEGYFKQCPITFKDINDIKNVFKEKLRTIYHTRITYPELKK
jgi:putative nucleotidyltransferase with HDIG domain